MKASLLTKTGSALVFATTIAFWLYNVTTANLDLLDSYALFDDELITFNGVRNILNSNSLPNFLDCTIDGEDQRYGRILWNVSAIASFIPQHFFGDRGQIFATRMCQALILLASYTWITFLVAKHWTFRALLLISLLSLPYTAYFATMPKPEPLQLLFLIALLADINRKDTWPGRKWFFLGLAIGTKISAIFLLPPLAAYCCYRPPHPFGARQKEHTKFYSRPTSLVTTATYLLGAYQLAHAATILAARGSAYPVAYIHHQRERIARRFPQLLELLDVPDLVLANAYAGAVMLFGISLLLLPTLISSARQCRLTRLADTTTAAMYLAAGYIIAVPVAFFKFPLGLAKSLVWILLNSTHGQDNVDTSLASWAYFSIHSYLPMPHEWTLAALLLSVAAIAVNAVNNTCICGRSTSKPTPTTDTIATLLLLFTLFSILPIFLTVKRLWGHYLHIGTVFFVALTVLNAEALQLNTILNTTSRRLLQTAIALFFFTATALYLQPDQIDQYKQAATRTSTAKFATKKRDFDTLLQVIRGEASRSKGNLQVHIAPGIFRPHDGPNYQIEFHSNPWDLWGNRPDLVFILEKDEQRYREMHSEKQGEQHQTLLDRADGVPISMPPGGSNRYEKMATSFYEISAYRLKSP